MTKESANDVISSLDATLYDIISVLIDDENRVVEGDSNYLSAEQELRLFQSAIQAQRKIEELVEEAELMISR